MNVVLMLAHSIEEWHQVQLMHQLGHNVFSIGAYIDPAKPGDDKRPALPHVPFHEDLARVVWATPSENGDSLWAAKDRLPDEVLDWADVVICHHVEWRWLINNWPRLRERGIRTIWRTVGQSTHENELRMAPLRAQGLQIVRYSPREQNIPGYAGHDALIRFWIDPDEMSGWHGRDSVVGNVTQNMRGRAAWCGYDYWQEATRGLRASPAGPESQSMGGVGALTYDGLRAYLRGIRAYLFTGTFPASYTLGLLEAMMTGVPVVAAGPDRWREAFPGLPYGSELYEAHEIAPLMARSPEEAQRILRTLLADGDMADEVSEQSRAIAMRWFSRAGVAEDWRKFLG